MSEMTLETLIKRLKRLGKGEHYCGDLEKIYLKTAKKSEYEITYFGERRAKDFIAELLFEQDFNEYKYGLEYATNGKIRYIGTNDLETLIIK